MEYSNKLSHLCPNELSIAVVGSGPVAAIMPLPEPPGGLDSGLAGVICLERGLAETIGRVSLSGSSRPMSDASAAMLLGKAWAASEDECWTIATSSWRRCSFSFAVWSLLQRCRRNIRKYQNMMTASISTLDSVIVQIGKVWYLSECERYRHQDPAANHQPRSGMRHSRDLQRITNISTWSPDQRSFTRVIGTFILTKWTWTSTKAGESSKTQTLKGSVMFFSNINIVFHRASSRIRFLPI